MVIGANGQDGSILSQKLELAGHEVVKVTREAAFFYSGSELQRINPPKFTETSSCFEFLQLLKPDVILHFAAVHAPTMVEDGTAMENLMIDCHVTTTKNILFWQEKNLRSKSIVALSSQMYSPTEFVTKIDENHPISPTTVYGETKANAFRLIREAREFKGINSAGAILFNHTSVLSKQDFLFPSLAKAIADNIHSGAIHLSVRNANAFLDIGSAEEYCDGVIKMIELEHLTDFVFSSNRAVQISSIIQGALSLIGYSGELNITSAANSIPRYVMGEPNRAKEILGWAADSDPSEILKDMILARL
jgi:GDPmannose 4,6-dehydratase